jgi:hypothetical protein
VLPVRTALAASDSAAAAAAVSAAPDSTDTALLCCCRRTILRVAKSCAGTTLYRESLPPDSLKAAWKGAEEVGKKLISIGREGCIV